MKLKAGVKVRATPAWRWLALGLLAAVTLAAAPGLWAAPERKAAPLQPDWAAPHVERQLLVKLPAGAGGRAPAQLEQAGVRVLRTIPALGLAVVETRPGVALAEAAADLEARAGVEWAEPNYTLALDAAPNDPFYPGYQSLYLRDLNMEAAWAHTVGRPEVLIAVVDTGVDLSHEDLSAAIWLNAGETGRDDLDRDKATNGIDDDGNGFVDDVRGWDFAEDDNLPDDDYGHGTHVAGIAAARIGNGLGIAGMAGAATIMPVDIFKSGIGAYDDLILALIYATDNGADVINLSLGASSYSRGEEMAVDYAWAHGVVVVAAAGNTGRQTYHYPAAHERAIAVAATTATGTLASFSTRGSFVDIAAPGSRIWSTYRDNGYGFLSGTSMATPHVSGLAALILAINPTLTPDAVRAILQASADDLGALGYDIEFGHGRINAARALAQTPPQSLPAPTPTPQPPLPEWPAGCQELITDGGFETGLGSWTATGDVSLDTERRYEGAQSVHFAGGSNAGGVLTRTVTLPAFPLEGVLWFAFRIENTDVGWGVAPSWPYDDWLTAEFTSQEGRPLASLLRTGNSADTAGDGLPWDHYLYRMRVGDGLATSGGTLAALRMARTVNLVFTAANDADNAPTDFWIDAVRFCVTPGYGAIFPILSPK